MIYHLPEEVIPNLVSLLDFYEKVSEAEFGKEDFLYDLQKQVKEKNSSYLKSKEKYKKIFNKLSQGNVEYEKHIEIEIEELKQGLLTRIKDCDYCLWADSILGDAIDIRLRELSGESISKKERFNLVRKVEFLKKDLEFLSLEEGTIH